MKYQVNFDLDEQDKAALASRAEAENTSMSALLNEGLKSVVDHPEQLQSIMTQMMQEPSAQRSPRTSAGARIEYSIVEKIDEMAGKLHTARQTLIDWVTKGLIEGIIR